MTAALNLFPNAIRKASVVPFSGANTVSVSSVSSILEEYEQRRHAIDEIMTVYPSLKMSFGYFATANISNGAPRKVGVDDIFNSERAIKALDASFWSRVVGMTDVEYCMPQSEKNRWASSIELLETVPFTRDVVIATLSELMNSRGKYFAMRVEDVFKNLSPNHVTNSQAKFGKRIILEKVNGKCGLNTDKTGYINDLRSVVGVLTRQGDVGVRARGSYEVLTTLMNIGKYGKWQAIDGGSLRIKMFKVGTVHIEIPEDIVQGLNSILAIIYGEALPESIRRRKTEKAQEITENLAIKYGSAIAFSVLNQLREFKKYYEPVHRSTVFRGKYSLDIGNDEVLAGTDKVIKWLGGNEVSHQIYDFGYDVGPVIDLILVEGELPDIKSYQFYRTKELLVGEVSDHLGYEEGMSMLEPSGGHGALASISTQQDDVLCVELSSVNAAVLKAKKYNVVNEDFISFSKTCTKRFDRIPMNPPFSSGDAKRHILAASALLADGGRLVAVAPHSLREKLSLEGYKIEYVKSKYPDFDSTKVSIVLVIIDKL